MTKEHIDRKKDTEMVGGANTDLKTSESQVSCLRLRKTQVLKNKFFKILRLFSHGEQSTEQQLLYHALQYI